MLIIDADRTRDAMPFDRLIEALRSMFTSDCTVPTRHVHSVNEGSATAGTILIMPAWHGRYLGIKTINIYPGNASRGLPGLFSTYALYDAETGEPLAHIDGNEVTARRTAGASALAASRLARPGANSMLVMGSGRIGRLLPHAYRAVLPIERVHVWSRSAVQADAMAASLREEGFDARATDDPARVAAEVDIVSCATLATQPVVRGEWLQPGSHLDLIGSFTPAMREADDACFVGASLWLDTLEGLAKSGDLIGPISRGVFSAGDVRGTLFDLARGTGHVEGNARTVFKSVGLALEDLAAAILVYEAAR